MNIPRWIGKRLHARLLLAAILIEALMLTLLVGNSLRLLQNSLGEQARLYADQLAPVLSAALVAPLAQHAYVTVQAILDEVAAVQGVEYLAVQDANGRMIGASGWERGRPLPPADEALTLFDDDTPLPRYDVVRPIEFAGQKLGTLHYGLGLGHVLKARDRLLVQGVAIALGEILLSLAMMVSIGLLLMRQFARLMQVSEEVAKGNFAFEPLREGDDDIGQLGRAFNAMARAVAERIRELEELGETLQRERDLAQVTLASIGDGVVTTDAEGRVTFLNVMAERLSGWSREQGLGRPVSEVIELALETGGQLARHPVLASLESGRAIPFEGDVELRSRDGRNIAVEGSSAPIFDRQGVIVGAVMVFTDVSTTREITRQMAWQATHDSLTTLVNRSAFEQQLKYLLEDPATAGREHALLYLDLDQFKLVNDVCGHAAGDQLLTQIAFLMQEQVRKTDMLARLGGDEFGVLLQDCPESRALQVAEALRTVVRDFRFVWGDKIFEIGVSIGLVMFGSDGRTADEILSAADMACYMAKEQGRDRIQVYRSEDTETRWRQTEMNLATDVRDALRKGRFVLYAQEIRPLHGDAAHFEVLVRMLDKDGQMVAPGLFIPAAERYGLMPQIDRWVIRQALAQAAATCNAHGIGLAINLSGLSLLDPAMPDYIRAQLAESGLRPGLLCLEITETAAVAHLGKGVEFMRELKALGCRFALDDFGSGMASFGYLKALPVDYLKIDGAFVRDILTDPIDHAFVESIHHIGKVMGKMTIAEFASDQPIIDELARIGVDYVQGYGVAPPRPLEEVLANLPG